jgi:hypothetical protein
MIGAAAATALCLAMIDIICIFVIYRRLSVVTLARGLKFDMVFVTAVACIYLLFNYINFYTGHHLLLMASLTVYLWKSIANKDIPLHLLLPGTVKP